VTSTYPAAEKEGVKSKKGNLVLNLSIFGWPSNILRRDDDDPVRLPVLSEAVLTEILDGLVGPAPHVPSANAITELAAATGNSEEDVRQSFMDSYRDAGFKGDPFKPKPHFEPPNLIDDREVCADGDVWEEVK
jgi:hypothetical protein